MKGPAADRGTRGDWPAGRTAPVAKRSVRTIAGKVLDRVYSSFGSMRIGDLIPVDATAAEVQVDEMAGLFDSLTAKRSWRSAKGCMVQCPATASLVETAAKTTTIDPDENDRASKKDDIAISECQRGRG
jgi:hypothetical protein